MRINTQVEVFILMVTRIRQVMESNLEWKNKCGEWFASFMESNSINRRGWH
ncbi:hypothetical protein ACFPCW_21365 [Vibrio thalassae]|uniref:hypothetical protein n=1 Tax=Vibrio thalassae TaxID=1243014 RepID=UPI0036127606